MIFGKETFRNIYHTAANPLGSLTEPVERVAKPYIIIYMYIYL